MKWTAAVDPLYWWLVGCDDGLRALWNGQHFCTMKGYSVKKISPSSQFSKGLPQGVVLDGILHSKAEDIEEILSSREPNWNSVTFEVLDIPSAGTALEQRMQLLKSLSASFPSQFVFKEMEKCNGLLHLQKVMKRHEENGKYSVLL